MIETIFQISRFGFYLVGSVVDRDYTTLAGVMIFYRLFVLGLNLVVDVLYGSIDLRIREKC